MDTNDYEHPPAPTKDAVADLVESIQFEDAATVAPKLRATIDQSLAEARNREALVAEQARSRATLEGYRARHADLAADAMAEAAIERRLYDLQREDLERAGVDFAKLRETMGRNPSPAEIACEHMFLRASGHQSARSTNALLDAAIGDYADWRGVRRRGGTIDSDRANAIHARKNAQRAARGLPPVKADEAPTATPDQWADVRTPAAETLRAFGGGDGQGPDPDHARATAIERMRRDRAGLRSASAVTLRNEEFGD
jgi:hypothetical protein